ncbi:ComF family protein [Sphingomonas bacterium]|uniref:ComF family protein n=1 Tax=Sphingomonas bacterium TaxID=1895847 RepID=UPI0015768C3C|nr:ComF family protein [Sphingomonas bacterium]
MARAAFLSPAKIAVARAVAFALPPRCPGCGIVVAGDHSFCLECWQSLDFLGGPACGACGVPMELAHHPESRCGACLADPPPFDSARAAVAYGPIARALALKLKHGGRPGMAVTMARAMCRAVPMLDARTLVVPVPLHRRRLWSRGYNQSALIARALARIAGGTLAIDLLCRRKPTPMLRGLNPMQRARTVAGAFAIAPAWKTPLKGRTILLIDDVYTTGATARACARVLRKGGASRIDVLCWARVVREEGAMR